MGNKISQKKQIPSQRTNRYNYAEVRDQTHEYDARVITETFHTILTGQSWPIEFTNWQDYVEHSKRNTSQIAVLGYENMGKSYILSKIMNRRLPQGIHTKTKGLCVLYPKEKDHPWTALDTPGTNISVKSEKVKKELAKYFQSKGIANEEVMRMLFGDNILMEALLQEFVVTHAQVILIVIGKLRRDDQRLISRIKALPGKRVLIVHNLLESQEISNVKEIIKEDLFGVFDVTEREISTQDRNDSINNKVYLEKDDKNTEHVILAHDNSPAGRYYNESTIKYIRQVITSFNHSLPFDLIVDFKKYLNTYIKKYLSYKDDEGQIENPLKLVLDPSGVPKGFLLQEYKRFDLKLSSANEFGNIQTFTREGLEHVPFSVKRRFRTTDSYGTQEVLEIEFEVVGTCNDEDLHIKIDQTGDVVKFVITGKSKENVVENIEDNVLQSTRKFGSFTIVTETFNIDGYTINKAEKFQISQRVPGLKVITFVLHKLQSNLS